ncbi:MAG: hypothetical protein L3K26_04360, partial [Candidatus Hydrogenedentes bacterium]|nr:hypothetical protein [Candidatus Hydrogenedentota bacterium]
MILFAIVLSAAHVHAVTVTGGNGASLSSITGSPTLVTVVLRGGAKAPNLQVLEVQGSVIVFTTEDGDRISYQKADIDKVEVQGSVVERRKAHVSDTVVLRPE